MAEITRVGLDDFNDVPANPVTTHLLNARTAREICALPDPPTSDLLLGPLVVRGARTIIVGDTGHGKTSLALQLATAVINGEPALGYTGAGLGPALVVDLEQGERSIKRILRENRLQDSDDLIYVAVPDGLELDANTKHQQELERVIVNHQPTVLILDPYYKAHRADSNEERAIVDLMRHLDELRSAYGFALMLPAHPRKEHPSNATGGARKLALSDVFGSSAVTRGAELVVALERLNHGYARLRYLKDRDHDLPVGETLPLLYTKDHGFFIDQKEERTAEELEQRIRAADSEWRTAKDWAAYLGIRKTRAMQILEQLAEAGRLSTMVGPPGRAANARCYSTVPELWEHPGTVGNSQPNRGTVPLFPTLLGNSAHGNSQNRNSTVPESPEQSTAFLDTEPPPDHAGPPDHGDTW